MENETKEEIKEWLETFHIIRMGSNPGLAVTYLTLQNLKEHMDKLVDALEDIKKHSSKCMVCGASELADEALTEFAIEEK